LCDLFFWEGTNKMGTPTEQGQHYFCIRLSTKKDMYVYADQADVVGGSIVLRSKSGQMNFALAPGGWEHCYLASTEDGSPLAVEHWTQDTRGLGSKESRFRRNSAGSDPIKPIKHKPNDE
jgi:hypothetical protein